jgi:hypothetical protein
MSAIETGNRQTMIEVFKTNVESHEVASRLAEAIQKSFPGYKASFDLDDCDRILRVVSPNGAIAVSRVSSLVKYYGFHAEALPDL